MLNRTRWTATALAAVALAGGATVGATAQSGKVTATPDRSGEANRAAIRLARAIVSTPGVLRGARFSALPPFSNPAAISSKRLAGFPRAGKTFGILSTGDALDADNADNDPGTSSELGGPSIRGARDVTILRIAVRVPKGKSCLSVRFRFLSEEFPEFVNDAFNDAFIAELDISNWDASSKQDPTITAPRNFAADARGNPIRVNAVGDASVSSSRAKGTTYDAATRPLRASIRVTPGTHVVYLSIFDQGDRQYDSAVFLDRLSIDNRRPCRSGAAKEA